MIQPPPLDTVLPVPNKQLSIKTSIPWAGWFNSLVTEFNALTTFSSGTYAARPSAGADGTTYYATDQGVTYIAVSGAWVYFAGTMRGTINPDQKPVLAVGDAGFLFYSTDYQHTFYWTGAAWEYAPGDDGSGYFRFDSSVPYKGTWQLCDGTAAVKRTTATGILIDVAFSGLAAGTVPTWNSGQFPRMSAAVDGLAVSASSTLAVGNDNAEYLATAGADSVSLHFHQHPLTGTIIPAHGAVLAYLRL